MFNVRIKKNFIVLKRDHLHLDMQQSQWFILLSTAQSYGWNSEFPISDYLDAELGDIGARDGRMMGEALQRYIRDHYGRMIVRQIIDQELMDRLTGPEVWPRDEIDSLQQYADFLASGRCEIEKVVL